ncbi:hypothetical protein SEVIR_9G377800v4 [Setaria viridis]|uniref:Dirigent protein n=1 Tax=Setaria viridis TaxID=4556 RepID=A0A4U6T288_SETVI|nr:dirigent protein 21-like [Setaria viridis]TKV95669.1 hypothetical protein SEVIR_9G377800v2 [Setaria viridis]
MSTATPRTLHFLALLATAITVVVVAAADDGMTHLHLYIHETVAGSPPLVGSNSSSFGSIGAIDDELRDGPEPASQYLGRAQGFLVQADLGNPAASCTILSLAFTEGDYGGSTLVVDGRVDLGADGKAVVERGVVGGTGRFRRARGYSLMTKFGNPTPGTVVFEMDLYVKISG